MQSPWIVTNGYNATTSMLAGVAVPNTPLVQRTLKYARDRSEPYLFNHAVRSWLFAVVLAEQKGAPYDGEVLAVSALLHDLGLTDAARGPLRFEVEGANAARAFARSHGMDESRSRLVWDSIALNSTPSICMHKETECALCVMGVGIDWGGWGYQTVPGSLMKSILEAFPRIGMKHHFTHAICRIAQTRPEATYDNFARDFGERFVADYRPTSSVDALLNAPFDE